MEISDAIAEEAVLLAMRPPWRWRRRVEYLRLPGAEGQIKTAERWLNRARVARERCAFGRCAVYDDVGAGESDRCAA